jgi:hypothetical protein
MDRAKLGMAFAFGSVVFLITYASIQFAHMAGVPCETIGIPFFFRCTVGAGTATIAGIVLVCLGGRHRRLCGWLAPTLALGIVLVTAQTVLAP